MMSKEEMERRLEEAMGEKFRNAPDPETAIHLAAAAGAGICALFPIGLDVWGLRTCEVIMVIYIASIYGEKLTKSAARGILASSFAQLVGEAAALTALEAADAAKLLNPVIAFGIKSAVAVSVIEGIGHEALKHYEAKCKESEKKKITAFDAICAVGAAADAVRIAEAASTALSGAAPALQDTSSNADTARGDKISFCGSNERDNIKKEEANRRRIKEYEKKVETNKRNLDDKIHRLEYSPTVYSTKPEDVKRAASKLNSSIKDLEHVKKYPKK